jgi:hypothetical protein
MAWDKERDRALSDRARTKVVVHKSTKYGTYTRKAGLARKSPGHQRKVIVPEAKE